MSANRLYDPPPGGKKLLACYAILFTRLSSSEKAVLGCFVKHANPKTGRRDPSQTRIARMTGLSKSSVERAIASLLKTEYLSRQRRGHSTNAYRARARPAGQATAHSDQQDTCKSEGWYPQK